MAVPLMSVANLFQAYAPSPARSIIIFDILSKSIFEVYRCFASSPPPQTPLTPDFIRRFSQTAYDWFQSVLEGNRSDLGRDELFIDLAQFHSRDFFSRATEWLYGENSPISSRDPTTVNYGDLEFLIRNWIVDCALHPEVRSRHLDHTFGNYKFQPKVDPMRGQATGDTLRTSFPELTVMLERLKTELAQPGQAGEYREDDGLYIYYMLGSIVQFGVHWCDNVMAPFLSEREDITMAWNETPEELRAREKRELQDVFSILVRNPLSEVPLRVRKILAEFDTDRATDRMSSLCQNSSDGCKRFTVYKWIVEAAISEEVDQDGLIRRAVETYVDDNRWKLSSFRDCLPEHRPLGIKEFSACQKLPLLAFEDLVPSPILEEDYGSSSDDYTDSDNDSIHPSDGSIHPSDDSIRSSDDSGDIGDVYRISREEFEVFREIFAWMGITVWHPDDWVRVVQERESIDLRDVSSPCEIDAEDGMCSICIELFAENKYMVCMKLNQCGHIFHKDCFAPWVKHAVKLNPHRAVTCPFCRRPLQPTAASVGNIPTTNAALTALD